jgi:hypothetical protein
MVVEARLLQAVNDALGARGLYFAPAEPPVRGLDIGRGERVALFVGRALSADAADAPSQSP